MRLTDVIISQDLEENIFGGIKGAVKGLQRGTPVKGYQAGYAQAQGSERVTQQATVLFKDFFNQMGQYGQRPRGKDLIDYLTQRRYPTKQALAILSSDSAVPARSAQPAAGNVAPEEPVEPATPPDVFKTNPKRGAEAPVAEARGMYALEISPKTAWAAILAATRENLKMGGGSAQGLGKRGNTSSGGLKFGSAQTPSSGSVGSILATGPAGSSASAGSSGLTPEAILQAYQGLAPADRKKIKAGMEAIDKNAPLSAVAESPVRDSTRRENYSRFLGQEL
jgi:hypothetical protein